MRWAFALVALVACGRSGFDPVIDGPQSDGRLDGDASVANPRCAVPARPDVSNPRITLGCDQIVAAQEILNGGVVRFDCGTGVKLGAPILVNVDTVIDGHGVVLDGQGITQVIRVNNNAHLTLFDVTVTRGASNGAGGGIQVDSGGLVAFDSTFTSNQGAPTGNSGGAIYGAAPAATVEIYGGRFSGNTCASGGAIYTYSDLKIVNATLDNNVALGTGGDVGTGGDGGAVQFAGIGDVTLCGDTFASNVAGHVGGAVVVISTDTSSFVNLTDVSIDSNRANGGGGAYFQDYASLTMERVSVTSNLASAGGGGGLWFEGTAGTFDGENVSVLYNRADLGTGAGVFLGIAAGRLRFSTIADNLGSCGTCVASAIANGMNVDLFSTVIVDSVSVNAPKVCSQTGVNIGSTWQWPGDPPLCAANATVTDPLLLPRANATGPAGTFLVRKPSSGSPVIGATPNGCPAEDLLGNPRPTPCAAGAVEP